MGGGGRCEMRFPAKLRDDIEYGAKMEWLYSSTRSGDLIVGDLYFQYKASPGIMTSFNTTEDSLPWQSPHSFANSRIEDDSFVSPKMNSHLLDSCM